MAGRNPVSFPSDAGQACHAVRVGTSQYLQVAEKCSRASKGAKGEIKMFQPQKRVVIYELKNGREEKFDVEDESAERANAERELHARESTIKGYKFKWEDVKDVR